MTREPGQGRRDLRAHLKPGAGKTSHRSKKGCPLTLLLLLALPVTSVAAGWHLAATFLGAAS